MEALYMTLGDLFHFDEQGQLSTLREKSKYSIV